MPVSLEFWDQREGVVITDITVGDHARFPGVGDAVDVYHAAAEGVCAYATVVSRHFYYQPDGTLVRVRMVCESR